MASQERPKDASAARLSFVCHPGKLAKPIGVIRTTPVDCLSLFPIQNTIATATQFATMSAQTRRERAVREFTV
jgi:hypothetical protein